MKAMQRRLDNILFSEIKYPPSRHFPVCKALAASLPPKAGREQTLLSHRALRMTAVFHPPKAETAPHRRADGADQNWPFSHGIWGRKRWQHYILPEDKMQGVQVSCSAHHWERGRGRTPELCQLPLPFPSLWDIQLGGTTKHPSTDADGKTLDLYPAR